MAGDWIKMRQDLHDDPSVVLIALKVQIDEDSVVGKLHKLWCWADKHTTDGFAPAIGEKWVDRYVSKPGFASAMVEAGWLSFNDSGIVFPNFDRHNGQSAKTRVEATLRQRLSRKNRDDGNKGNQRSSIPKPFVRFVLNRDKYKCVYCGTQSNEEREQSSKSILSIDHLIPESRGGDASISNLVCACKKCNNEKNDRTPEEWGLIPSFLSDDVTYINGQMSQISVTKALPEKRREEKRNTNTETQPDGFVRFWDEWPKNDRKQDKRKCLAKWKSDKLEAIAEQIVQDVALKKTTEKWKAGYVEAPLVYLNNRRWDDGVIAEIKTDQQQSRWETRGGVEEIARELGLPPWSQVEHWYAYKRKVETAYKEKHA